MYSRTIEDLFREPGIKLTDAQKFQQASQEYQQTLKRWGPIGEQCRNCQVRLVLPQYTTSSLPIRPVWDGVTKVCIVCAADGWDYYSTGVRQTKAL